MLRIIASNLLFLFSVQAWAVPPPQDQFVSDCESQTYASDVLVCGDQKLMALDNLLYERIKRGRNPAVASSGAVSDAEWFRRSRLCAFEPDHSGCLLAAYCFRLALINPPGMAEPQLQQCEKTGDYISAAAFSRNGFVISGSGLDTLVDREINVWGFVDQQNLYGNDDVRRILGDLWSGYGPDTATWRFNLKARRNDSAGQSFPVFVPNDFLRDDLLRVLVRDASQGHPTKVYLTGVISVFDAPVNTTRLRGLSIKLQSVRKIHLDASAFE